MVGCVCIVVAALAAMARMCVHAFLFHLLDDCLHFCCLARDLRHVVVDCCRHSVVGHLHIGKRLFDGSHRIVVISICVVRCVLTARRAHLQAQLKRSSSAAQAQLKRLPHVLL